MCFSCVRPRASDGVATCAEHRTHCERHCGWLPWQARRCDVSWRRRSVFHLAQWSQRAPQCNQYVCGDGTFCMRSAHSTLATIIIPTAPFCHDAAFRIVAPFMITDLVQHACSPRIIRRGQRPEACRGIILYTIQLYYNTVIQYPPLPSPSPWVRPTELQAVQSPYYFCEVFKTAYIYKHIWAEQNTGLPASSAVDVKIIEKALCVTKINFQEMCKIIHEDSTLPKVKNAPV